MSAIRDELSAPSLRRTAIARALAQCPPGKWIEVAAFFDHVRAAGHDFTITRTPWLLYFDDFLEKTPVDVFSREDCWTTLQGCYVLCVLFDLWFPEQAMNPVWSPLLPGFTWLNWPSFLLGLVETFAYGWYVALVFGPLYNFFAARFG